MKIRILTIVSLFAFFVSSIAFGELPVRKTVVSIKGESFCINGVETFKNKKWRGYSIEGLLPNSRMVNGIFDDETDSTRYKWVYPDTKKWDADRNNREFFENMSNWKEYGLLAFTINLQGGSPEGYSKTQPWKNTAIDENGELKLSYMNRLEKVLDKADQLGMVAIVGIYYFGQEKYIKDEAAVVNGVKNTVNWILQKGYTNVLIEIDNECDFYKHAILAPQRVHELILLAKGIKYQGRCLSVSTSYKGGGVPSSDVIKASDFVLIHGNGIDKSSDMIKFVEKVRNVNGFTPKPVVINEDDHFDFEKPFNNFIAATSVKVSWGYFDYRRKDEPFEVGYQSIPADWSINTERKKGFFSLLNEWGK